VSQGWAINIDIEGFSENYEHSEATKTYAIQALAELMRAIIRIGTHSFPGRREKSYSDRLFAHQFGDGFLICSEFEEPTGKRAMAIAVTIMRHMIDKGYATKAAVSSGSMSDIKGCYPSEVRDAERRPVDLGMGLMTTISVMGTALTRAHKLAGAESGAVLIVEDRLRVGGLPEGARSSPGSDQCIDWVTSELPWVTKIARESGLEAPSSGAVLESLNSYCQREPTPPMSWQDATWSKVNGTLA